MDGLDKIKELSNSGLPQDIESKAEIDINVNRYRRKIYDLVVALSEDFQDLISFAY